MEDLKSIVEFNFQCMNLPNMDKLSKTDAYIIIEDLKTNKKFQTEVVDDDLNPKFVKSFEIEYFFEKKQPFKATVYDKDDNNSEFIGSVEFTVSQVMGIRLHRLELDLKNNSISSQKLLLLVKFTEKTKRKTLKTLIQKFKWISASKIHLTELANIWKI
jgi:Ca2+-dependent lipid-binding protein